MKCPACGTENENGAQWCGNCGAKLAAQPAPVAPQPVQVKAAGRSSSQEIPAAYQPLSPWAYFGWQLLFAIPFAGFVLLIVMSFAPRNKNLKNFARSYWCALLIGAIITIVAVVIAVLAGVSFSELMRNLS